MFIHTQLVQRSDLLVAESAKLCWLLLNELLMNVFTVASLFPVGHVLHVLVSHLLHFIVFVLLNDFNDLFLINSSKAYTRAQSRIVFVLLDDFKVSFHSLDRVITFLVI